MSQFIVSARKYRPTRFADVLGQEHISHTLKMAFSQDKLAHAFLFTGPRGVGKTTCARILAKTLNCLDMTADYEPCGKCESCISFDDNASFSIFELDAASNNSVDHIRNLIEQVRIPPLSGKYKVFIIDEVHMLSTAAFNAFLKTLEEPPPYAIFILATTEKHKILPTILSRCQIFDFRRLQVGDIVKQLNIIASQESIKAEEEALHLIATKADGAMRDALSIFDRIAGATNNHITYDAVTENLNLLDYTYYFKVVDQLLTEDLSGIMLTIDEVLKKGFDPEVFLTGLSEHFRQLLVSKDVSTITLIENTTAIRDKYLHQSQLVSIDYLLTWMELCSECDINFRTARNKRLHLEMTMIKMIFVQSMINGTNTVPVDTSEKKAPEPVKITLAEPTVSSTPQLEQELSPEESDLTLMQIEPFSHQLTAEEAEVQQSHIHEIKTPPTKLDKLKKFEVEAKSVMQDHANKNNEYHLKEVIELMNQYNEKASVTVKLILQSRLFDCDEENVIKFTVGSNYERETLINETALLEFLRHHLRNVKITFGFIIDPSLMGDMKSMKPLTSAEKFKILNEKNPLVQKLFDRLNVKMEE